MDFRSNHELESTAFALFKKSRKEHIKIDFPNMKEDDIERRLTGEWENLNETLKSTYIEQAGQSPRFVKQMK
jgi:hypothetical protein